MLINETKLKATDNLEIRNYITLKQCRHNAAGRVAMLIKQHIPYKIINPDNQICQQIR